MVRILGTLPSRRTGHMSCSYCAVQKALKVGKRQPSKVYHINRLLEGQTPSKVRICLLCKDFARLPKRCLQVCRVDIPIVLVRSIDFAGVLTFRKVLKVLGDLSFAHLQIRTRGGCVHPGKQYNGYVDSQYQSATLYRYTYCLPKLLGTKFTWPTAAVLLDCMMPTFRWSDLRFASC